MLATILSVGLALLFPLYFQAFPSAFFPIVALTTGALMLLITPLIKGLTYLPLQAATVEISSRSLQYARKDLRLKIFSTVWILFGLFSIVISVFSADYLFFGWVIWLGFSLDAIYWYVRRVTRYCDPHAVVDCLIADGEDVIGVLGQEGELLSAIDGLAEVSLKALLQRGVALADHAVRGMERLAEELVKEVKNERDRGKITNGEGRDKIHFAMGYMLQRLQTIFSQAGEEGLEQVASRILMTLSKMVLFTVDYGEEEAVLPYHYLDRLITYAEDHNFEEVFSQSSVISYQLALKLMEKETPVAGLLLGLIENMEEQAKQRFKEDKNTPIDVLTKPFEELKLVMEERELHFEDVDVVKSALGKVIGDFVALQEILMKVPNIPGYSKKEE